MADLSAVEGLFGSFSHYIYEFGFPSKPQGGNLGKFVRAVQSRGVAHSHLFLATIFYSGFGDNTSRDINLFCHATGIPALNIMTNHYRENEAHYEVPYGYSYEPVTLQFYGDTRMLIKSLFDTWYHNITNSRAMTGGAGNNRLKFMDEFTADVELTVLDKQQNEVYKVRLIRAWPKSVGNIDLNSQNTNVVSFPVQFVYERLEIIPIAAESELGAIAASTLSPANFPVNVFNKAEGAASDLMQSATGFTNDSITNTIKTAATNVNTSVDDIRSRVPTVSVDGLFRT